MSLVYEQRYKLTASDVDMWQRLRLSVLFQMLQEISIAHTEVLGAGRAKTLDQGALWVVSRMKLEITRMPVYDEVVVLKSWPGEMMRVLFPRYYQLETENGDVLLRASGIWLLINQKNRHMTFPDSLGVVVPKTLLGNELDMPSSLATPALEQNATREIRYSEIDINGHMNNSKYLDWMDDLFPVEFHETHALKELQINFLSETRCGQKIILFWHYEEGMLFFMGRNENIDTFKTKATFCSIIG